MAKIQNPFYTLNYYIPLSRKVSYLQICISFVYLDAYIDFDAKKHFKVIFK